MGEKNLEPWTKTDDGYCIEASDVREWPKIVIPLDEKRTKTLHMVEFMAHKNNENELTHWTKFENGIKYTVFND